MCSRGFYMGWRAVRAPAPGRWKTLAEEYAPAVKAAARRHVCVRRSLSMDGRQQGREGSVRWSN